MKLIGWGAWLLLAWGFASIQPAQAQNTWASFSANVNVQPGLNPNPPIFPANFSATFAIAIHDTNHNGLIDTAAGSPNITFPVGLPPISQGTGQRLGSPSALDPSGAPDPNAGSFCGDILVYGEQKGPGGGAQPDGTTYFMWFALQDPNSPPKPAPCNSAQPVDFGIGAFTGPRSNPTMLFHDSFFEELSLNGTTLGSINPQSSGAGSQANPNRLFTTSPGAAWSLTESPNVAGNLTPSQLIVSNVVIDIPFIEETTWDGTTGFLTGGPNDFVDSRSQQSFNGTNVHVCAFQADGQTQVGVLRGTDVPNNLFMCLPLQVDPNSLFVDTSNTGTFTWSGGSHSVHVCPSGTVMAGYHSANNWLICGTPLFSVLACTPPATNCAVAIHVDGPSGSHELNLHVCDGTNAHAVMVGIHEHDDVLICAYLDSSAIQAQEDDGNQASFNGTSVHVCPFGAMSGVDAQNNRFTCLSDQLGGPVAGTAFVDPPNGQGAPTTQTFNYAGAQISVHVCPDNNVMVGWHEGKDWLICAPTTAFIDAGPRADPPVDQTRNQVREPNHPERAMHVCDGADAHAVMIGLTDRYNVSICRSVHILGP